MQRNKQVCVQPSAAAVNVTLLAFAADRRAAVRRAAVALLPLSIDISCPRRAQQQTRRTLLQQWIDGTYRQMNRRTDGHRTVS